MGIYEVSYLAEKPGRPVGTMRLRSLLTITNALLIGCLIGWSLRTHAVNDRWMMAKIDKYETETSYWLHKLDDQIQENKGDIAKEKTHVTR